MAHESFEDNETANLMNKLFINIKVDREERPDLDFIFQVRSNYLIKPGGWPLTMFLDEMEYLLWDLFSQRGKTWLAII